MRHRDFQLFFEELPDELLVLLPDTPRYTVVAATKACLNCLSSTPAQVIGRGVFELDPGAGAGAGAGVHPELLASLERVLETRLPDTMQVLRREAPLPDGEIEVRYLKPTNIPIVSASGEVRYILHRTVDVTGWQREIEQAHRELDAFSHSVTHDLRGPLHSIDGFSELLLEENAGQLNDAGRDRLTMVRKAAQRMARLIDDLLRFTRLSRGEMRRVPFELSMLARSVAGQMQQANDGRSVKLTIQEGVNVDGDPQLLQLVLENLFSNAWKFTSQREGAEIEFGCGQADGEACYYVRDNGAGFDVGVAPKLFGEFPGTGVGLATVKRIVARHGGRVWAVGAAGQGATFYFTLGGDRV